MSPFLFPVKDNKHYGICSLVGFIEKRKTISTMASALLMF